jgi:hypothetical protein
LSDQLPRKCSNFMVCCNKLWWGLTLCGIYKIIILRPVKFSDMSQQTHKKDKPLLNMFSQKRHCSVKLLVNKFNSNVFCFKGSFISFWTNLTVKNKWTSRYKIWSKLYFIWICFILTESKSDIIIHIVRHSLNKWDHNNYYI